MAGSRHHEVMHQHLVAIPILPVGDMAEAVAFWSRLPHLTVDTYDEGYAFVKHLGVEVIHLGRVNEMDVDANAARLLPARAWGRRVHDELAAIGVPVTDVRAEPWGMREFRMTDPSGNVVRFGCGD